MDLIRVSMVCIAKENMIVLLVPETSNINDVVVVEDTDTRVYMVHRMCAGACVHHRYFFFRLH